MKRGMKILLFCLSSLVLISWDRASKELAKEHLMDKAPQTYFHDTFRLQYVENTGAALSIGDNLPKVASFWLLSILPLVLLLFMSGYAIKHSGEMSTWKLASFALIVAGASAPRSTCSPTRRRPACSSKLGRGSAARGRARPGRERDLRRLGQGRRRQVDADRQPRRGAGRRGQAASACSTPTCGATRSRACSASRAARRCRPSARSSRSRPTA